MAVYRAAFSDAYSDNYESDSNLLFRCELVAPCNLLRILRLMMCVRVVLKGSDALIGALVAGMASRRSWLKS
eukprot:922615-Karenia_brevis.AAC.1